jgi:hypothetical protein
LYIAVTTDLLSFNKASLYARSADKALSNLPILILALLRYVLPALLTLAETGASTSHFLAFDSRWGAGVSRDGLDGIASRTNAMRWWYPWQR